MAVAVETPLDGLDERLSEAPLEELGDTLSQVYALECAARSARLSVVRTLSAREGFCEELIDEGCTSVADWLCVRLGVSRGEANEFVSVASLLGSYPLLASAHALGQLSWGRLVLILKFVTPETEAMWASEGQATSIAALKVLAAEKERVSDEDVTDAFARRTLKLRNRGQSTFLSGNMPLDLGAVLKAALDRGADQMGPTQPGEDPGTLVFPDRNQAHLDALMELVSFDLGDDPDVDRATVVVEVKAETLFGEGHTFGPDGPIDGGRSYPGYFDDGSERSNPVDSPFPGSGYIDGLGACSSETVRRMACDARVEWVVVRDGETIGIGRASRTIPWFLRRRLKKRDQGCRFPGCNRIEWVHGHHKSFWSEDGPTDIGNLVSLCPIHHHLVHEGHWRIEGDPNGTLQFLQPDGSVFDSYRPTLRPETWNDLVRRVKEDEELQQARIEMPWAQFWEAGGGVGGGDASASVGKDFGEADPDADADAGAGDAGAGVNAYGLGARSDASAISVDGRDSDPEVSEDSSGVSASGSKDAYVTVGREMAAGAGQTCPPITKTSGLKAKSGVGALAITNVLMRDPKICGFTDDFRLGAKSYIVIGLPEGVLL